MSKIPIISIVGRQNVGKSTLFNCILKKSLAITQDYPGVTRDILQVLVEKEEFSRPFYLCDTPGLDIININDLSSSIIEVSFNQLLESDLIIFMMARNEVKDYDNKLVELFKKDKRFNEKNIIYCINKSDNPDSDFDLEFYYRMGLQEVIPISALGRRNVKLLFEKINFYLSNLTGTIEKQDKVDFKVAIAGKPNSGKSSFLNSLLGYNRAVVSEIPGTTRDTVNSYVKVDGNNIEIVDTAGIRKYVKSTEDSLEYYSFTRTLKAIEESNIVILLIDAQKGIGEYDKKIYAMIREKGKAIIIAINKWDLVEDKDSNTFEEYKKDLISRFHPVTEVPIIAISAKENQRVRKVLVDCIELFKKTNTKIPTSVLNQKLKGWFAENKLISLMRKAPKLLYATQTSTSPFRVLFFVNDTELFKPAILAYLKKKFITEFDLYGIQIEIELRSDRKSEKEYKEDKKHSKRKPTYLKNKEKRKKPISKK